MKEKYFLKRVVKYSISLSAFSGAMALAILFRSQLQSFSVDKWADLKKTGVNLQYQFHRYFALKEIQFEEQGSSNLSHWTSVEQLRSVMGIRLGEFIWDIPLSLVEKKILTVPWISSVQIQKVLPATLVIKYSIHHARALGVKNNRVWSIANDGRWIAPLDRVKADVRKSVSNPTLELPVLNSAETISEELQWLDVIESKFANEIRAVHEIEVDSKTKQVSLILSLEYSSREHRVLVRSEGEPSEQNLFRLRSVIQYLIKNNVLVSSIDIRYSKKVVVNLANGL